MEISELGGPSFSPTNPQEILVVGQLDPGGPRGIYVYDLATGGIRTIVEPAGDQYVQDVAWLPDGEHIIYRLTASDQTRVVAADGSGDRAFDALRGRPESARCPTTGPGSSPNVGGRAYPARLRQHGGRPASMATGSPSSWPAALGRTSSAHGPGSGRRTTRCSSGPSLRRSSDRCDLSAGGPTTPAR